MDTPQQYPTMWTTGYIGSVKVSFTFPIRNEMEAYAQAKAITDKLLADGFMLHAPGLEAGEVKEQVGYVSRRQKKNDDGSITPIIDVYSPNDAIKFKFISVYLNTADDVTAFENASGLKVARLPLVPGKAALDKSDDSGAIVLVGREMFIVIKPNPYFDPDEKDISKMKPKNTFIRWEAANALPTPTVVNPTLATDYAALEAEARRKAQTALDNEMITIFKATYEPNHNGQGVSKWKATARTIDGATIVIPVYKEDVNMMSKAGHVFPDIYKDSDSLNIPVITEMRKNERRIKSVESATATTTPVTAANPFGGQLTWLATPVKDCVAALKAYLVSDGIYTNEYEMKNSLVKRGVVVGGNIAKDWQERPASELVAFLRTRHDEMPKASGQ